jgi:hypothetical protein
MLLSTSLLTDEERAEALGLVPDRADARRLAGRIYGSLKNQSIDLIDAALGPNHARAALVAIYEGVDLLLEATIDLAESVARQLYFTRTVPTDPLGTEPLTNPEELAHIPWRFARYSVEDAAIRVVSAGDHMANAHVRLAWEANAATLAEVTACRFDPAAVEPKSWIDAIELQAGLKKVAANQLAAVFATFAPNDAFKTYMASAAVERVRAFRHAVIHRARPTYRELPALGRTSLWSKNTFSIKFPPPEPGEELPTMNDYRDSVRGALGATFAYATELWEHSVRWLRSVDVWITYADGEVTVQTKQGTPSPFPREHRDPGPFLSATANP